MTTVETSRGETIELTEAAGAFDRIEAWLRDRGFFTPDGGGLVADVYLGYGLSAPIRRRDTPLPPEPCPLPLAACSVRPSSYVGYYDNRTRPEPHPASANGDVRVGRWDPTWSAVDHGAAVERVRTAIARGDVYQVNLVQHMSAGFAGSAGALAARLAPLNPHIREPF